MISFNYFLSVLYVMTNLRLSWPHALRLPALACLNMIVHMLIVVDNMLGQLFGLPMIVIYWRVC